MKYVLTLLFILSANTFAKDKNLICKSDKRITTLNYIKKFKPIKKAILKETDGTLKEKLQRLIKKDDHGSEVCAWNAFQIVDFLIYFDRFKQLKADRKRELIEISKLRDRLYLEWLKRNEDGVYSDYTNKDLKGMSLQTFLKKKSDHHGYLEGPIKIFNLPPKKGSAKRFVYDLIGARTPFNAIFVKNALDLLLSHETTRALLCTKYAEGEDLLSCFRNSEEAINILGVLSSQRMYLIRDLASFIKQNYSEDEYKLYYKNASLSSYLYFKLETLSYQNELSNIYSSNNAELTSPKPYHFYSVAYIAKEMKKSHFSDEEIKKYALFYALKYKKNIKWVGYIYNLLAGIPFGNGASDDFNQIKKEQEIAIDYVLTEEIE